MRLKNVLIVVNDMEKSILFYKDLFGLDVVLNNEGNVILTEGLVLQDATGQKMVRFYDLDGNLIEVRTPV